MSLSDSDVDRIARRVAMLMEEREEERRVSEAKVRAAARASERCTYCGKSEFDDAPTSYCPVCRRDGLAATWSAEMRTE